MMSKRAKSVIALSIASILCMTSLNVYANDKKNRVIDSDNYIIRKISNPTSVQGEADGLVDETDRANGYVWGMAETGQYIYMGSNRNFLYNVVRQVFGDGELSKLATNIIFKGDIATDTTDFSGKVIRYDKESEEFEVAYSSETAPNGEAYENAYRSGLTFKTEDEKEPSVYLGSYGGQYTRVLKFKPDYDPSVDTPEVVFNVTSGNTSVRAMAEHNRKMYLGSMIVDEDLRILESDDPAVDNWKVIANLSDFDNLPSVADDSTGTAGVFDLISYNGYLYAIVGAGSDTSEENSGFMVFKGKDVGVGTEGANEAGWQWDVVVGQGGKYEKGMGISTYNTATAYKYTDKDGKEYVYVGSFPNAVKSIMNTITFDFSLMYESFMKPTQLYRFDENDNWELVMGTPTENEPFTEKIGNYKAGFVEDSSDKDYSSNQYVWRMSEYNGKLFTGTFDAATLYDPFVPDKILDCIDEEDQMIKTLLAYSNIINEVEKDNSELAEKLRLENTISEYTEDEIMNDIATKYNINEEADIKETLDSVVEHVNNEVNDELIEDLRPIITEELADNLEAVNNDDTLEKYREELSPDILAAMEQVMSEVDINSYSNYDEYLDEILSKLQELIGEESVEKIRGFIEELTEKKEEIDKVINEIIEYIHSSKVVKQYEYMKSLQEMIAESDKGFDLFVTEDGVNFENLTTDGFDDDYNMGLRTFISSTDGLYIGTANPFYGCQLWRLNEKSTKAKSIVLNDGEIALDFNKDVYEYNVNVDNSIDTVKIAAEAEDASSKISYNEVNEIAVGDNKLIVTVINIDGESGEYVININRQVKGGDNPGDDNGDDNPGDDNPADDPSQGGGNTDNNNDNPQVEGSTKPNNSSSNNKNQTSMPITGGQNSLYVLLIAALLIVTGSYAIFKNKKKRV